MKLKNLFAGVMASAVAATALAAAASANEAFLMYTDDSWAWGVWDAASCPGTADVTGDGTYTVYVDSSVEGSQAEDEDTGELVTVVANGAMVFCVDIDGLAEEHGFGKGADGYEDLKTGAEKKAFAQSKGIDITDLKITTYSTDGTTTDIPVDLSKIIFGDIEGNGKLRIEIQNEYGDTAKDPAIDKSLISFDDKIEVTFTVTGLDGGDLDVAVDESADDFWSYYDAAAMKELNEKFELGGKLDLYAILGDDWNKFTKIEADFTWTPGEKWCGGAGIANGIINGETWTMGAEFGAANANEAVAPDGKATQTILDLGAPMETIAVVNDDGTVAFAELQVQNWWNGTEAGAKVEAIRFLAADGSVVATFGQAPQVIAPAPVTGDVDAATDSSKGSPDTGAADVAAVAGLAVIAAGAVAVAKKRK
ncbi:MAG: hypothetical protein K5876_02365 [Ruminiclostridium sp.]|nr:hypothetical protein [Ruminiclostridium sp.]